VALLIAERRTCGQCLPEDGLRDNVKTGTGLVAGALEELLLDAKQFGRRIKLLAAAAHPERNYLVPMEKFVSLGAQGRNRCASYVGSGELLEDTTAVKG
jgi:hypothetical protein